MKRFFTALMMCAVFAAAAFAQNYPFPQNVSYAGGVKPAAVDAAKVQTWYNSWKQNELLPCVANGIDKGIMPMADNRNQVKVEGVGWALIAAAYMGDQETFDGIYKFYSYASTFSARSGGMMSWLVTCNGVYNNSQDNEGTAADGDLDVAFGLIVASWQWGSVYLDSAKALINRMKPMVRQCDGLLTIAGGYSGGAWPVDICEFTDMSYYTPAFFRVFAEVSSDADWDKLADDTYTHLERNANTTTGLVSDWQSVRDGAPFRRNNDLDMTYNYDASRVPWRLTLDYLWNGNTKARDWAQTISNWAHTGLQNNTLKNGHQLNGTANSGASNAEMAFLGGWAVSAMANTQAIANAFGTAVNSRNETYWYHIHTGNMYLLTLTGNMWHVDQVAGDGPRITVTIEGSGVVRRSPDKTAYSAGETVTLTAEPGPGFKFQSWSGAATGTSSAVTITMDAAKSVTAKFVMAADGTNYVKDGDFPGTSLTSNWSLGAGENWGNSQAAASVSGGKVTIDITNATANTHEPQLYQRDINLYEGMKYSLTFTASAAADRNIHVILQRVGDGWTTYKEDKTVALTTAPQTFTLEFEMTTPTDLNTQLAFNLGGAGASQTNVTISDVKLVYVADPTNISGKNPVRTAVNAKSAMRVTAKSSSVNVKFNAASGGETTLKLFNLKGDVISTAKLKTTAGKSYSHTFKQKNLPNGFYVVRMQNGNIIEQSRVMLPK